VSVYRGATGNPLGPFDLSNPTNATPIGLGLPDGYTTGVSRIIGYSMEYCDTTAPLYRQGSLTAFKQPSNSFEAKNTSSYVVGTLGGTVSTMLLRRPPRTVQEANLLAGTLAWKAEDGFYMVNTPIEAEIPAKTVDDTQPVIFFEDFQQGARDLSTPTQVISGLTGNVLNTSGVAIGVAPTNIWNLIPWNSGGVFLLGLNQQHTGLLRCHLVVERFPSPSQVDFSLSAKPCAEYCPEFFIALTECLREMPVAARFSDNSWWEWAYTAFSHLFPAFKALGKSILGPKEEPSKETKEIARLTKSVEKLAKKPVVVNAPALSAKPVAKSVPRAAPARPKQTSRRRPRPRNGAV
jgi:hypothetical protein